MVVGGRLVAAASEERFSRKKGAGGWPEHAIAACLAQAGADPARLPLAEAFIRRRSIETDHMARRIEENAEGRLESDTLLLQQVIDGRI